MSVKADNPDNDCTELAHPAWFRGQAAGIDGVIYSLNKDIDNALEGKEFVGVCTHKKLQELRERIHSIIKGVSK